MGCVMISCPVTGNAVSTGIETDHYALELAKAFKSRSRCSECGGEHIWSKTDVWICDTVPYQQPHAA